MKFHPATLFALLLGCGTTASGQTEFLKEPVLPGEPPAAPATEAVKYVLIKPNDKTSELVNPEDRNPLGKSESEMESRNQKGTSEENQIRELLDKLRVVGVTPGPSGLRVMLGDMLLEEGQLVPQMLPQQSTALKVQSVTPDAINFVWVERKPTGLPPRVLTIAMDLRPSVRVRLMGQPTATNRWEKVSEESPEVTRQFPTPVPQATSEPLASGKVIPKAVPAEGPSATAPASPAPAVPAAATPPQEPPSPEWDEAMKLLKKIMPTNPPSQP